MASLDFCLLKIERAKEHRDALQQYVSDTFAIESNRPRCGIKFDPDTGDYILFVNYMPDLGDFLSRCSLILGDGVHNLISALNHLAFQLAILHTGGAPNKPSSIQFPICDTINAWNDAKVRRLGEVAPNHVAIIERFQGYHRIDEQVSVGLYFHPLSKLRDLDSANKHRLPIDLVIPTSGWGTSTGDTLPSLIITIVGTLQEFFTPGHISGSTRPVAKLGTEVVRAKLPPGVVQPDMEMACYISPHIAIDGDRPAIHAFDKIATLVVKIVREFEPFF
jgi:hypothetical protein